MYRPYMLQFIHFLLNSVIAASSAPNLTLTPTSAEKVILQEEFTSMEV